MKEKIIFILLMLFCACNCISAKEMHKEKDVRCERKDVIRTIYEATFRVTLYGLHPRPFILYPQSPSLSKYEFCANGSAILTSRNKERVVSYWFDRIIEKYKIYYPNLKKAPTPKKIITNDEMFKIFKQQIILWNDEFVASVEVKPDVWIKCSNNIPEVCPAFDPYKDIIEVGTVPLAVQIGCAEYDKKDVMALDYYYFKDKGCYKIIYREHGRMREPNEKIILK